MAENGEEGVRMARKEIPDLVITDVMMPVMNGFECCRILKEDLKTCHIPIILLTALTDDENIVKGIELGADDYILKPFNPEILRTKVKTFNKKAGRTETDLYQTTNAFHHRQRLARRKYGNNHHRRPVHHTNSEYCK